MSASAIVMMCIACVGLWGGSAASLMVMFRYNDKKMQQEIEEAEPETITDRK